MGRTDSSEKTLMLGKTEGRRRRGWQKTSWLDGVTDAMDTSLSKLQEWVMNREAWRAAVYGVAESGTSEPLSKNIHTQWTTRTCCAAQETLLSILSRHIMEKRIWKNIYVCICIPDSLSCTPETNHTVHYASIKEQNNESQHLGGLQRNIHQESPICEQSVDRQSRRWTAWRRQQAGLLLSGSAFVLTSVPAPQKWFLKDKKESKMTNR